MRKHGVALFGQARVTAGHVQRHTYYMLQAVKRELFMTTKRYPTGQHTPQNTTAHGITAKQTLCHSY